MSGAQHQSLLVSFERDAAAQLIKIQNEKLAEFCAATRPFVAFATAACSTRNSLPSSSNMRSTLGLRGLSVGGSVAGQELADRFDGLGQGRRARHPDLHAPDRHPGGAERPPPGQWC
jgi:hypothetical protein